MSVKTLIAVVALAGSIASTAQAPVGTPTPQQHPELKRSTNPYARLFLTDQDKMKLAPPAVRHRLNPPPAVPADTSQTVCGLTIWNVSPDLDRRMLLRRHGNRIDYKIEKLAPAVCGN